MNRLLWPWSRKCSATEAGKRDAGAGAGRLVRGRTSAHFDPRSSRCSRAVLVHFGRSSRGRDRCPRGCARRRRRTPEPPCALATLLISSWMSTVLPAGAAEEPDLAATRIGREQVDDDAGDEDLRLGGLLDEARRLWWMTRRPAVLIGPASSTGSPMTFMMRPSVSSPTGTEIGSPVSVTGAPRTSLRWCPWRWCAQRSPRCCTLEHQPVAVVVDLERVQDSGQVVVEGDVHHGADHRLRARLALPRRQASLQRPLVASCHVVSSYLERLGRNDFDQFLGDLRLPLPVVLQRQRLIISLALRVALSMALICAPKNEAWFSSSARNTCTEILRGSNSLRIASVRLVVVGHRARPGGAAPSTLAGISCCAVGTWLITERKRA